MNEEAIAHWGLLHQKGGKIGITLSFEEIKSESRDHLKQRALP